MSVRRKKGGGVNRSVVSSSHCWLLLFTRRSFCSAAREQVQLQLFLSLYSAVVQERIWVWGTTPSFSFWGVGVPHALLARTIASAEKRSQNLSSEFPLVAAASQHTHSRGLASDSDSSRQTLTADSPISIWLRRQHFRPLFAHTHSVELAIDGGGRRVKIVVNSPIPVGSDV